MPSDLADSIQRPKRKKLKGEELTPGISTRYDVSKDYWQIDSCQPRPAPSSLYARHSALRIDLAGNGSIVTPASQGAGLQNPRLRLGRWKTNERICRGRKRGLWRRSIRRTRAGKQQSQQCFCLKGDRNIVMESNSYTEALIDRCRVMSMVGWFISARGGCMAGSGSTTITSLYKSFSLSLCKLDSIESSRCLRQWVRWRAWCGTVDSKSWGLEILCRRNHAIGSVRVAVQDKKLFAGPEALCVAKVFPQICLIKCTAPVKLKWYRMFSQRN